MLTHHQLRDTSDSPMFINIIITTHTKAVSIVGTRNKLEPMAAKGLSHKP